MKPDPFRDFVLDQMRGHAAPDCRAMFGGYGLYADGKFFGLIHRQRFYLKTDAATRKQFETAGMSCFQPIPGQKLGAYYEVPADILENATELDRWVREAIRVANHANQIMRASYHDAKRPDVTKSSAPVATKTREGGIRAWWLVLVLCLGCPPAFAQSTNAVASLAELQQRLTAQLAAPRFAGAVFGVKIVSLDTGKTLFAHDADKLLSPASNCKLYTVALALDQLGGDYRIRTSLYAAGRTNRSGTLKGDLIVYGRGSPDFNARLHRDDIFLAFEPLVALLTNAGIKRVTGDLIGDESHFRGPPFGSGWAWDDSQYYYGAEISALTVNDNILKLTVTPGSRIGESCRLELSPATTYAVLSNRTETVAAGGRRRITLYRPPGGNLTYVTGSLPLDATNYTDEVTVHRPARLFVEFLREAMKRRGITVKGRSRVMGDLERGGRPLNKRDLTELGVVESLPLRTLASEIQKPSQNLYTDLLLAHVGARAMERRFLPLPGGPEGDRRPPETAEEAGVRELEKFLGRIGIGRDEFRFEEGSGLSRNNLATANATVSLLEHMSRHAEADAYLNALPVAGVDGTLRNRMKNTPAAGNVRAKTGTLRWASALSGHVKTAAAERLIFSLMLNRYVAPDNEHTARAELDRIALLLAAFAGHSASNTAATWEKRPGVTGTVQRLPAINSKFVETRHVDVWLPPSHGSAAGADRRYPVLYVHDGQNIYDPALSFIGVDWGLDETMTRLITEGRIREAIVVAVWNTPKRLSEYMPQKAIALADEAKLGPMFKPVREHPLGDAYLKYLVQELKPAIDAAYPTLPGPTNTFIMGSSMGGLISLYALGEYPEVFGGAACLSTAWPVAGGASVAQLKQFLPAPGTHRLYFDYGTETMDGEYEPWQKQVDQILRAAGYEENRNWLTKKFPGDEHSERAWSRRVHVPLEFLLGQPTTVSQ